MDNHSFNEKWVMSLTKQEFVNWAMGCKSENTWTEDMAEAKYDEIVARNTPAVKK